VHSSYTMHPFSNIFDKYAAINVLAHESGMVG
jgi:hypothetical protein